MNQIYKILVRTMLFGASVALYLHVKSNVDMRKAATQVSAKIEKEGVKAELDADGSVIVKMDGKI